MGVSGVCQVVWGRTQGGVWEPCTQILRDSRAGDGQTDLLSLFYLQSFQFCFHIDFSAMEIFFFYV